MGGGPGVAGREDRDDRCCAGVHLAAFDHRESRSDLRKQARQQRSSSAPTPNAAAGRGSALFPSAVGTVDSSDASSSVAAVVALPGGACVATPF